MHPTSFGPPTTDVVSEDAYSLFLPRKPLTLREKRVKISAMIVRHGRYATVQMTKPRISGLRIAAGELYLILGCAILVGYDGS